MGSLAVTYTFAPNTNAASGQVNTNNADIVNYINLRNAGSSTWDAVSVLSASNVPLTLDNSSGSQNIATLKANGSNVITVSSVGLLTVSTGSGHAADFITTSAAGIVIKSQNLSTSGYSGLEIFDSSGTDIGGIAYANSAAAGFTGTMFVGSVASKALCLITNNTERARLDTSGNLVVGATSATNGIADATRIIDIAGSAIPAFSLHSSSNGGVQECRIASGGDGMFFDVGGSGTTANNRLVFRTYNGVSGFTQTARVQINSDGGVSLLDGSGAQPTGNSKGSGTLNASGDIYKNNSAYANPDYVFEKWITGKIEKFINNAGAKDYAGPLDIDSLRSYVESHLDLPGIKSPDGEGQGIFERADRVLEKLEEAYIYIFQLHERLNALEASNG